MLRRLRTTQPGALLLHLPFFLFSLGSGSLHCLHCSGVSFFSFFIYLHSFPLVLSSLHSPIQLTVHHKRHPHTLACTTPPSSSFTTASDYHQHHFFPIHSRVCQFLPLPSSQFISPSRAHSHCRSLVHYTTFNPFSFPSRTEGLRTVACSLTRSASASEAYPVSVTCCLLSSPSIHHQSSVPPSLHHFVTLLLSTPISHPNLLHLFFLLPSEPPERLRHDALLHAPQLSRLVFPHETSHVQPNGCGVSV